MTAIDHSTDRSSRFTTGLWSELDLADYVEAPAPRRRVDRRKLALLGIIVAAMAAEAVVALPHLGHSMSRAVGATAIAVITLVLVTVVEHLGGAVDAPDATA